MIQFLARRFIRDCDNVEDPAVRRAYGALCGCVGIGLNVLLFLGKLLAGLATGSVAVTADAVNNLSDAGSSVVTLLGFKLAAKIPDRDHPFGHGRMEYVSGLVVSMAIILMGVELARTALEQILRPKPVDFTPLAAGILLVSIAVKTYMALYNRSVGRRIGSAAMSAAARDSLGTVWPPPRCCWAGWQDGSGTYTSTAGAAGRWPSLSSGPAWARPRTPLTPCWASRRLRSSWPG